MVKINTMSEENKIVLLKRVVWPFWGIQTGFCVVLIGFLGFSLASSGTSQNIGLFIADMIHLVGILICTIIVLTEMILFMRHRLRLGVYLGLNITKTMLWTLILILSIVSIATSLQSLSGQFNNSAGIWTGLVLITIVFLLFLGPLIYASVVFNRQRIAEKAQRSRAAEFQKENNSSTTNLSPTSAFSGHTYVECKIEKGVPNGGYGILEADSDVIPPTFEKDGLPLGIGVKPAAAATAELDQTSPDSACVPANELGFDEVYEMSAMRASHLLSEQEEERLAHHDGSGGDNSGFGNGAGNARSHSQSSKVSPVSAPSRTYSAASSFYSSCSPHCQSKMPPLPTSAEERRLPSLPNYAAATAAAGAATAADSSSHTNDRSSRRKSGGEETEQRYPMYI